MRFHLSLLIVATLLFVTVRCNNIRLSIIMCPFALVFYSFFKDFGNSAVQVLLQKFQPALEAAGIDPSEIMPEWIRFKHLVYARLSLK